MWFPTMFGIEAGREVCFWIAFWNCTDWKPLFSKTPTFKTHSWKATVSVHLPIQLGAICHTTDDFLWQRRRYRSLWRLWRKIRITMNIIGTTPELHGIKWKEMREEGGIKIVYLKVCSETIVPYNVQPGPQWPNCIFFRALHRRFASQKLTAEQSRLFYFLRCAFLFSV